MNKKKTKQGFYLRLNPDLLERIRQLDAGSRSKFIESAIFQKLEELK